jgi:hypothetical protein
MSSIHPTFFKIKGFLGTAGDLVLVADLQEVDQ